MDNEAGYDLGNQNSKLSKMEVDESDSQSLPPIVKRFYDNVEFVNKSDGKVQMLGQCKRCRKKISGCWKPVLVTSNMVTHVKVLLNCNVCFWTEYTIGTPRIVNDC